MIACSVIHLIGSNQYSFWSKRLVPCFCVSYHWDFCVSLLFSPCLIPLQSRGWEEVAQCVFQTGCVIWVSKLTTHFCTLAGTPPSLCSPGFGEFSWNTHIHHCQGHKQLSISSNPLFRINTSFSCSLLSCAVTFLWLIKFDLADRAQHDAWQVTYIGVSNPLQRLHK